MAVLLMRVWCAWLVLIVAAGPTLLDRCLVNCHETGGSGAAPTCHGHALQVSSSPAWQSTEVCHHDHEASWEATSELRPVSLARSLAAAPPAHTILPDGWAARTALVAGDAPPDRHAFPAFPLPLRL